MSENVEQKKPTKLQIKKMEQYQERRRRLINKGVPEAQVDAVIAREDYEKMPVADKLKRLESFVAATVGQLAEELNNLRHNDQVLADAMDINFRAITKALTLAGVDLERQKAVVAEVQAEMEAAQKAQKDGPVNVPVTPPADNVDVAGEAPPAPEAATTFGG